MYRVLEGSGESVLGYHLSGNVTEEEVEEMQREISSVLDESESVRLLIEMGEIETPEPAAVWQDLKMTPEYVTRVERFAVVGHAQWHEWVAKAGDLVTQGEARYFPPGRLDDAWAWISS